MLGRFTVYRDVKLASETSSNGINSSHYFIRFRYDDLCYLRSRIEGKMTSVSISVLRNYLSSGARLLKSWAELFKAGFR